MPTIAFYIRNTAFFNNYIKPYSDILINKGYKVIILHTNSLTKDISDKKFTELESFDIGANSIKKTIAYLKKNNISAVVNINFHSPMDLLVNRLLNYTGIKSVYMEHGILADESGKYIKPPKPLINAVRFANYLKKYIAFSFVSKSFIKEILIFHKAFIKKQYKVVPYNHYLLYSPRSFDVISKKYILNDTNVSYSGYPIDINVTQTKQSKDKYILYIHQPHVKLKLSNCSYKDEVAHFNEINRTCIENGFKLIIKLHPAESTINYSGLDKNIEISKEATLPELINQSSVVIGHYSTALFTAVKYNKPIVQVKPDCYNNNINFDLFKDVALQAFNKYDFERLLKDENILKSKLSNYTNFLDYYLGENNTFEHRVETMIKIVKNA